jgi:hypothetical protein
MRTLSENARTSRVSNSVAAGTTTINSAIVDAANYGGVRFEALLGAITTGGSATVKVQSGNLADGSDMADLAGASVAFADTDDNAMATIEVRNPRKRYHRCTVVRSTQNTVIDGIVSLLLSPSLPPTTDDSTVKGRVIINAPADA